MCVCVCVCVCVCACACACVRVCVYLPLILFITTQVNEHEISNLTSSVAFRFLYMAFTIDIMEGSGLSNKKATASCSFHRST